MEIIIDGVIKATDTLAPYTYAWNTQKVALGIHTIQAKAYDAAGNTFADQIMVTVVSSGGKK